MRRKISLVAAVALLVAACETGPVEQETLVFPEPPETARYVFERTIFGSHAVKQVSSSDKFKAFATGAAERGKGFSKPFGVAASEGRVYVSDTVSRKVAMLDFINMKYEEIGVTGDGKLAKPMGLAVDGAGNLYVADATAKKVVVFDAAGEFVRHIGAGREFERLNGVAVTKDGSRVYVLDTGGVSSTKHDITMFDGDGKFIKVIGKRGSEPGEFNLPLSLTVGPNDQIYVMDSGNFRVQVLDSEGEFIREFGEAGRNPGRFSHPKGIAVDSAGRVYVSDSAFAIFQIFNAEGEILMFIGERDPAPKPAKFMLPAGMAVDVDGRIYAVDQYHRKVDVFRPAYLDEEAPVGLLALEPEGWSDVSDIDAAIEPVLAEDQPVIEELDPDVVFFDVTVTPTEALEEGDGSVDPVNALEGAGDKAPVEE